MLLITNSFGISRVYDVNHVYVYLFVTIVLSRWVFSGAACLFLFATHIEIHN